MKTSINNSKTTLGEILRVAALAVCIALCSMTDTFAKGPAVGNSTTKTLVDAQNMGHNRPHAVGFPIRQSRWLPTGPVRILILGIALVLTFIVGWAFSFIVCCAYHHNRR